MSNENSCSCLVEVFVDCHKNNCKCFCHEKCNFCSLQFLIELDNEKFCVQCYYERYCRN